MYSTTAYGGMIADGARTDAYVEALRRTVKPGAVVVDVGTGAGIFAILACRFGARKVYAIESADIILLAKRIAADNGCDGQIEFIQARSTEVTLAERADVLIADLHGRLPFYEHHIASIADARDRFLAPEGVLIPQCDHIWMAPVDAPELYRRFANPWVENRYGVDMRAGASMATSDSCAGRVQPKQLLAPPQCWAKLAFQTVVGPNVDARVAWTVQSAGTCHGFIAWFDTTLADGVCISNGPGTASPSYSYSNEFFPWSRPVELSVGDAVEISCKANFVGGDYVWSWDSRVVSGGEAGHVKADFRQSTFFDGALSPDRMRKLAANHVPALSDDGQIDRLILEMMEAGTSLGDIATRLTGSYPGRFARWQDALTRAGELSSRYS